MRDSQGRDSFTEDALLSASDWCLLVLTLSGSEEHRLREQRTIVRDAGLHTTAATSFGPLQQRMWFRTPFVLGRFDTRLSPPNKVIVNCATGAPTLRVEASSNAVERGLRQRFLSRTSLKRRAWFQFIPSLQLSFANNSKGLQLLAQRKRQLNWCADAMCS